VVGSVEHLVLEIREEEKIDALRQLIYENKGKMMVFFNTIDQTDKVTTRLKRMGVRGIDCIHSKRDQTTREMLITSFRSPIWTCCWPAT